MSREIKESNVYWIGGIPKQWKLVPTKRVLRGTKSIVGSEVDNYERLALTMNGVIKRNKEDNEGLQPEKFDNYQILRENELVFKLIDLQNEKTSRVGLSPFTGIVSPAYIVLTNEQSDNRFYYYWFFDMYNRLVFNQMSDDGVRANLNVNDLVNIPIPLISLSEQKAIADFLDRKCAEIDEMIALQEKIVEELKAYKQSVITEVVTKGLNPDVPMKDSGIEWIGEIPEHWSIDKIIRSFGLIGSGTTPKSTDEDNFIGNIRWIQSGDINGGVMTECKNRISEKTLHTTSALKIYNPPFIIIAMYGASVGNTSISMIDGCVNQACCVLSESYLNLEYSFNVIKSCKDFWIRKAVGGGQPNISQDTIKSTWVPIPPKEEQKQIASYLNTKCTEIDNLISIKLSKIDSLKEYKKSIIYEYVTGKKEVEA